MIFQCKKYAWINFNAKNVVVKVTENDERDSDDISV